MRNILDCYLVKELTGVFLFSVGLLSSLGVSIGTVSDLGYKVIEYQLPIPVAILIFVYKIPEYAAYALPISVLLTGLNVYSRLNRDRELVALLSFGISFYRITLPAIVFSLVITGITFLLNELVVPAANYQASLLQNPFIAETELNRQTRDIFYLEYQSTGDDSTKIKNIYYAERYYRQSLKKVTIVNFDRGKVSEIITAKSARWDRQQNVWDLVEGKINRFGDRKEKIMEEFTNKQLPLSGTIFKIAQKKRSPEEMNIRQAKEYLKLIEDSASPTDLAKFTVRIQQKYAFPFICIIFSSIGSALGAKYSQDRSKSFGLCVAIVFIYYLLAFAIGSLGITGIVSPVVAAWLPNLVGAIVGGYLIVNRS